MSHLRYMGTKRALAPIVANVVAQLPAGPCLDLFAGMCSVAGAISSSGRQVWCNDLQKYAALVADSLIGSTENPPSADFAVRVLQSEFDRNMGRLKGRLHRDLERERKALAAESYYPFVEMQERWKHVGNDPLLAKEAASLRTKSGFPYRLITLNFAHGYFGLRQANELDCLRYAIDKALAHGSLTVGEAKWCLVALLQTANRLVTSTGHFAQYLEVRNRTTFKKIKVLRKQVGWDRFLAELQRMSPYGSTKWRGKNRVFCEEAVNLSHFLSSRHIRPSVIYADPPYSEAQYSRYYHVLETLVLYDYPLATGKGRYRTDRFNTAFSKPTGVHAAFQDLIDGVSKNDAALVLSYPSNGLLFERGHDLFDLLSHRYRSVSLAYSGRKAHSTFGAWPGEAKRDACEMIIVATKPR